MTAGIVTIPYVSCGRDDCDCPWDCPPGNYPAPTIEVHVNIPEPRCEDVDHAEDPSGGETP